jgi:DnaJ-class molecular chaperone
MGDKMNIKDLKTIHENIVVCPVCKGQGTQHVISGNWMITSEQCSVCRGVGSVKQIEITTYERLS